MGQQTISCHQRPTTPNDLLTQQLSIYQWRSNQNFNTFISRTSFKSAYIQHQEEKLAEFLKLQEQKEYLEIYKFKRDVQELPKFAEEQIIVFEKYKCTLKELAGQLNIEEIMYTTYGLLVGYQEIRRMLQRVVVQQNCCFVCIDGGLRVWINPNYKSNELWMGSDGISLPLVSVKDILSKIMTIAEGLALITPKSNQFFKMAREITTKSTFKQYSFAVLKQLINQFCYLNNIQMSRGLASIFIRQQEKHNRKSYIKHQINTEEICKQPQNNKLYVSTMESQHYNHSLQRSKSLGPKGQKLDFSANFGCNTPNVTQKELLRQASIHILPVVNTFVPKKQSYRESLKYSDIIHEKSPNSRLNSHQYHYQINKPKESTLTDSKISKGHPSFLKNKNKDRESELLRENATKENRNGNYQSYIEHCKHSQVSQDIKEKRDSIKPNYVKLKNNEQKHLKVSIMQNIPQSYKQQTRHKTCFQHHTGKRISNSSNWSRPWITVKTITKLISQDEGGSLKQSIAQSSDYYNDSAYSGALTQMGRNIVQVKDDRTRTVRISRQVLEK